jgi:O-antigen/teichoic acid export membrane protein
VTAGFLVGAGFNLVANLLLIPRYGYVAAAVVTVASEAALLGPFALGLRGRVSPPPILRLAWRPALASLAMGVALYPLLSYGLAVIPLGAAVYAAAMLALGGIGPGERALLKGLRRRSPA